MALDDRRHDEAVQSPVGVLAVGRGLLAARGCYQSRLRGSGIIRRTLKGMPKEKSDG